MKNIDKDKIARKYKQKKCTCDNRQIPKIIDEKWETESKDKNEYNLDQITFIAIATEIVSIIAFVFFGCVIFWLAIAGALLDFFKELYYSDRCKKFLVAGLFALLLVSMTTRLALNKRACRKQIASEQMRTENKYEIDKTLDLELPIPPPEYLEVTLKDKTLKHLPGNTDTDSNIKKQFTITIVDEQKKELFKTSKVFSLPEMVLEMKRPPALIVYLKELVLDNY